MILFSKSFDGSFYIYMTTCESNFAEQDFLYYKNTITENMKITVQKSPSQVQTKHAISSFLLQSHKY